MDDRPPLREAVPLGFQHLVAMLLGNITPPLLVAGALSLSGSDTALLLQAVFFMAGLATLVQAYPIGPVGGRIPVVMGTSIAFVTGIIVIGREYGLGAVFGACLVASVVEILLGFSISRLRTLFPPLVNGIVVMLIGLTLIPVGMDYAAGGVGAADYGAPANLLMASVVFLVTLVLNRFAKGFLSHGSLLVGVVAGYATAIALGRVDFSSSVGRRFARGAPTAGLRPGVSCRRHSAHGVRLRDQRHGDDRRHLGYARCGRPRRNDRGAEGRTRR